VATVGLLVSLLGGIVIGPFLCIVALSRIKRSGRNGRELAIIGLAVGGLWILGVAAMVVVMVLSAPRRDADGQVTAAGTEQSWTGVRAGDCLAEVPATMRDPVRVVPCAETHRAQVVAAYEYPVGDVPSAAEADDAARAGCRKRLSPDLADRDDFRDLKLEMWFDEHPTSSSSDRQVRCIIGNAHGPLTDVLPMGTDS
jgi:hypothetical protein